MMKIQISRAYIGDMDVSWRLDFRFQDLPFDIYRADRVWFLALVLLDSCGKAIDHESRAT